MEPVTGMTLPRAINPPYVSDWITLTESGQPAYVIRQGELAMLEYTSQRSVQWRTRTPLGSVTPVRTVRELGGRAVSISGVLVPGRLAAGLAHLRKLEGLAGKTVAAVFHADAALNGNYQVDPPRITGRWAQWYLEGGRFEFTLTEVTAEPGNTPSPTPTTPSPTPTTPPAFVTPDIYSVTIGEAFTATVTASVPIALPSAGGYYMTATDLPLGITFTAPATISGTATAGAKSGPATLTLLTPDGQTAATKRVQFNVRAMPPPPDPPPATPAVRFKVPLPDIDYSRTNSVPVRYVVPLINPDGGVTRLHQNSGWTLTVANPGFPGGLAFGDGQGTRRDLIHGDITDLTTPTTTVTLRLSGPSPDDASSAQLEINIV